MCKYGGHGPRCDRRWAPVSRLEAERLVRATIEPLAWQRSVAHALYVARHAADSLTKSTLRVNLSQPKLKQLLAAPPIYGIEDFLSASECEAIISAAPPLLKPSKTSDTVSDIRTSATGFLPRDAPLVVAIFERVENLLSDASGGGASTGFAAFEDLQVARYEPSQRYEGHFDGADPHDADAETFFAGGGQRVATVLIYLNSLSPSQGGATAFTLEGVTLQPKRGQAVVFFPGFVDGTLDKRLWHEARPATCTKWVAQLWVRQIGDPIRALPRHWLDAIQV